MRARTRRCGAPFEERFWAKVDKTATCWLWTASTSRGYGQINTGSRPEPAHRVAYRLLIGPIPDGLQIDHLCRNRACVNPEHLEPVTTAENTRRGLVGQLRVACKRGHPFTAETTRLTRDGYRLCTICDRLRRQQRVERARTVTSLPNPCRRGHPMEAPNLLYSGGSPECRACKRIRSRDLRARKKQAA